MDKFVSKKPRISVDDGGENANADYAINANEKQVNYGLVRPLYYSDVLWRLNDLI